MTKSTSNVFKQTFMIATAALIAGSNAQEKRHFRGVASHIPPYDLVTTYPNGSFEVVGSSKIITEWLMQKLKASFEIVRPSLQEVKEKGWEASFDMMERGEADFALNGFAISPARYTRFDWATFPIWEESFRMVVPIPGEKDRFFAFIDPFSETVWILLAVSFVIISLFMGLLTWLGARYPTLSSAGERKKEAIKTGDYVGKYFLYNVNVLTTHGDYLSESKTSFMIAVTGWLLAASVLVYSYSSIVVSSITLPRQMPAVNSFEDVVTHPDVSLIVRTDTAIGNVINSSNDSVLYRALRKKASTRPESIGNEGVINTTQLLLTGKYAYPFLETAVRFIVANLYVREKKCRLKLSKKLPFSNTYFYYSFRKGEKLSREISIGSIELIESGLIRQCVKFLPWIPKADKCFAEVSRNAAKQASIKLVDLTSVFLILGLGVSASVLAFLIELIVFYWRCKNRRTSPKIINHSISAVPST